MSRQQVVLGDCVEMMKNLKDESIDAVVTDPPYDLTQNKKGVSGAASVNLKTPHGRARIGTSNGGFMGKDWDATGIAFDPKTWEEAFRILKPGGHLLAFGGTRTYHRLACAIEDAGFEIRDSIGVLGWVQGQGFPKSRNVSKEIDRMAGAEREVVGYGTNGMGRMNQNNAEAGYRPNPYSDGVDGVPITAAATPEAKAWDGWGTALKPSWEPIVVARKPLVGTVAKNVLLRGTGAINVDACRVERGGDNLNGGAYARDPQGRHDGSENWRFKGGGAGEYVPPQGGWPSNLLLAHHLDCREVGTKKVKAITGTLNGSWRTGHQYSGGYSGASAEDLGTPVGKGDADGNETVKVYECVPGCPAQVMDEQSGAQESKSAGASRFFPQFTHDPDPFLYVPKATRKEREAGLDHLEEKSVGMSNGAQLHGEGYDKGQDIGLNRVVRVKNSHPTVKPVKLMRWLLRLVTPPSGVVLDPFCGSGTTLCAAALEDINCIGIERSDEYVKIAEGRVEHWKKEAERKKTT
jgi:DNA modification methylase